MGLLGWLRVLISIHALLAESDTWIRGSRITYVISIHALLAESDMRQRLIEFGKLRFLSTLSLRRATVEEVSGDTWLRDFYPRSPCGERRITRYFFNAVQIGISIHALLAESDVCLKLLVILILISIHALLAESDCPLRQFQSALCYFYPRSPCGERR